MSRLGQALPFASGFVAGKRRFGSREALERYQERRVRRHVAWVRKHAPFYAELWGDRPDADWRSFPAIDKAAMMAGFDRLVTVPATREEAWAVASAAERSRDFSPLLPGGLAAGLSSGTSGHRGLFLVSEAERAYWAGAILAKLLPRPLWEPHRVAFFLRANSALYEGLAVAGVRFRFFDLLDPLPAHVRALAEFRPTALAGPPSLLRLLADAQLEGRMAIAPEIVVAAAEVLDPLDASVIEAAFGKRPRQVYQATEGFLGSSCARGGLHLNESLLHVEPEWLADGSGRFTPVITDFSRRTQPIVRYRLNDVLVAASAPCPCGSPERALLRIEGRGDDVFWTPAMAPGAPDVPVWPDFLSRAVLSVTAPLQAYRLRQLAPLRVEVQLDPEGPGARAEVEAALAAAFDRLGARVPAFEAAPYAPPPPGTKLRRIERAPSA